MEDEKIISATNEDLIWQKLEEDFKSDPEPVKYHAVLEQNERRVLLDIFNNHEVGFRAEAFTIFSSYIYNRNEYRFALHKQGFIDEIGKFLGMQDCVLGFKEFDERLVVKTSDEERTKLLFSDASIRGALLSLPNFTFGVVDYTLEDENGKAPFLELKVDCALTDLQKLRTIYTAFFRVLEKLEY